MSNYRRGPNDKEWKNVVAQVRNRDGGKCRLMVVLKTWEFAELKKNAPRGLLHTIDPAHVISASAAPSLVYDVDNVVMLNRYSHQNLDYNRCPVTGRALTKNQVHQWWARIVGVQRYKDLLTRVKHPPTSKET